MLMLQYLSIEMYYTPHSITQLLETLSYHPYTQQSLNHPLQRQFYQLADLHSWFSLLHESFLDPFQKDSFCLLPESYQVWLDHTFHSMELDGCHKALVFHSQRNLSHEHNVSIHYQSPYYHPRPVYIVYLNYKQHP